MTKRLSPKRLEEIRHNYCARTGSCKLGLNYSKLLAHIDALEEELREAKKSLVNVVTRGRL